MAQWSLLTNWYTTGCAFHGIRFRTNPWRTQSDGVHNCVAQTPHYRRKHSTICRKKTESARQTTCGTVPSVDRPIIQKNSIAEYDLNNTSALDDIGTRVRQL